MKLAGIPQTVEVRTLAARQVVIEGGLTEARMPRLAAAIASADAPAQVRVDCSRDEEGRYIAALDVSMQVAVTCQRCLTCLTIDLQANSLLAAVWTDEQAQALPTRYEPLITEGESDLWQMVEDELLLALPAFSYHDDSQCAVKAGMTASDKGVTNVNESLGQRKENPFGVLATLKAGGNRD